MNPRDRDRARRRPSLLACALALTAVTQYVGPSAAQEAGGSIHGRVVADGGAPVAGVRVVVQSPGLTSHREALTSRHGDYLFSFLPAADYVVTFAREGLVTVKRTTRLSALESVLADAVMFAAGNPDESILVVIDPEAPPRAPVFSENYQRSTIERLPLNGGLLSALTLPSGDLLVRSGDALMTFDGAPVRFAAQAPGRPPLDPGGAALREATFVTSGAPAEAGHFQSGVIAIVTPAGGDRLSGAVGATIASADTSGDAVERAQATDGPAVRAHYQIGAPLNARRTWLFAAGRNLAETVTTRARLLGTALSSPTRERFRQAKGTHTLSQDHRLQGLLVSSGRTTRRVSPAAAGPGEDPTALEDRTESHRLLSGSYRGVFGRGLQLAARVTGERLTSVAEGPERPDLVSRTTVLDQQTGSLAWAPGSCTSCDPDRRTSTTWRADAAYSLSTPSDTHQLKAGLDGSFGRLDPAGVHPDGGFELHASRFLVENGRIYPVLESNGSAAITWHAPGDNRLTHGAGAFFISDEWRRGQNLTIQAGVRWDRHRLSRRDTAEDLLTESGFSPRFSVSWSPPQSPGWVMTAGYARYAGDLLRGISAISAGPAERRFLYQGIPVNTSSGDDLMETAAVVDAALNWLFANGGTGRAPSFASEPGLTTARTGVGDLPHESEWALGASRHLSGDARVRADFTWRRGGNLREWRVDPASGPTMDLTGHALDQATPARTDVLERQSAAFALQLNYNLGMQASMAARYTASRLWGTADRFPVQADPFGLVAFAYPEYVDSEWAAPSGDLSDDRRHRLKLWGHFDVIVSEQLGTVGLDVLQTIESGRPYGLVSWIDVSPFVENPGYAQPPTAVPYYFTARDAFRTPSTNRTDLSVRYARPVSTSIRSEILVQFHILNLFGGRRVLDSQTFAVATTAFTDPERLASFNPFTQSPEAGVHWDVDTRLLDALETTAMTLPRAYRLSVGFRF